MRDRYNQGKPISVWAEDDRPREKMMNKGASALSDSELLAIIIGSGNRSESAVDLGRRILQDSGNNLHTLGRMGVNDLQKFTGIGQAKAVSIKAALELGLRRNAQNVERKRRIGASKDVFDLFHPKLADLNHEEFWMVCLSQANGVKGVELISKGGMTGTVADPRLIFNAALMKKACSIILVHNHPSGNLKPSTMDVNLTKKLVAAGEYIDIRVLDHVIVSDAGYFSFADEGMI